MGAFPFEKQTNPAFGTIAAALADITTVVPVDEEIVAPAGIFEAAGPPIDIPFTRAGVVVVFAKFNVLFPMAVVAFVVKVTAVVIFQPLVYGATGIALPVPLKFSVIDGDPNDNGSCAFACCNPQVKNKIANTLVSNPIPLLFRAIRDLLKLVFW